MIQPESLLGVLSRSWVLARRPLADSHLWRSQRGKRCQGGSGIHNIPWAGSRGVHSRRGSTCKAWTRYTPSYRGIACRQIIFTQKTSTWYRFCLYGYSLGLRSTSSWSAGALTTQRCLRWNSGLVAISNFVKSHADRAIRKPTRTDVKFATVAILSILTCGPALLRGAVEVPTKELTMWHRFRRKGTECTTLHIGRDVLVFSLALVATQAFPLLALSSFAAFAGFAIFASFAFSFAELATFAFATWLNVGNEVVSWVLVTITALNVFIARSLTK